jgi:hypothetical protein
LYEAVTREMWDKNVVYTTECFMDK